MDAGQGLTGDGLRGWSDDDHAAALSAYAETADLLPAHWPRPDGTPAEAFFAGRFVPRVAVKALVTGYFEPEFAGSDQPDAIFRYPLYGPPPGLTGDLPWHSRAEIEQGALLAGHELVWLASAVDVFFAQVQGSVRVRLRDGRRWRFGFAARNGHDYRSIGRALIDRGEIAEADISAQAIRRWCDAHPARTAELLRHNPSFVFFRRRDATGGPIGSMGRPVTPWRSIAVDPAHIPLGAPVWLDLPGRTGLAIAQDTGSAITGPGRADLFCGSGPEAGEAAGRMLDTGKLTVLLPRGGPEGRIA